MGRPPDCHCHCGNDEGGGGGGGGGGSSALINACPYFPGWRDGLAQAPKKNILVVQVCNTNNSPDDGFIVHMNGTPLGSVYLADGFSGAIYISNTAAVTTIDDDDPLLICPNRGHSQNTFDPSVTTVGYPGSNEITMTRITNNGLGNYGLIRLISYAYPYVKGEGFVVDTTSYSDDGASLSFGLCPTPATITASTNGIFSGSYTISSKILDQWEEFDYQESVIRTPGTFSAKFVSTTLNAPIDFKFWWYRKNVGSGGTWQKSGLSVLNTFYIHLDSEDTLEIWPDHN